MRVLVAVSVLVLFVCPLDLYGWGMDVHRGITGRALDGLPAGLRPFFLAHREFVAEHSVDPDLWRIAGLSGALGAENANHYFNIDALDEPAPFRAVPRDRAAFVRRYGERRAGDVGRLPWQTAEIFAKLVAAFRAGGRGTTGPSLDVQYFAAVIAHYVEDAYVPFHAVRNHDGQLTGQPGLHARFETELIRRGAARFKLPPVRVTPVPDIVTFMFQTLIESESLTADILDADRRAIGGRGTYDDRYYAALLASVGPLAEGRVAASADGVASVLTAAWRAAGSPVLSGGGRPAPPAVPR